MPRYALSDFDPFTGQRTAGPKPLQAPRPKPNAVMEALTGRLPAQGPQATAPVTAAVVTGQPQSASSPDTMPSRGSMLAAPKPPAPPPGRITEDEARTPEEQASAEDDFASGRSNRLQILNDSPSRRPEETPEGGDAAERQARSIMERQEFAFGIDNTIGELNAREENIRMQMSLMPSARARRDMREFIGEFSGRGRQWNPDDIMLAFGRGAVVEGEAQVDERGRRVAADRWSRTFGGPDVIPREALETAKAAESYQQTLIQYGDLENELGAIGRERDQANQAKAMMNVLPPLESPQQAAGRAVEDEQRKARSGVARFAEDERRSQGYEAQAELGAIEDEFRGEFEGLKPEDAPAEEEAIKAEQRELLNGPMTPETRLRLRENRKRQRALMEFNQKSRELRTRVTQSKRLTVAERRAAADAKARLSELGDPGAGAEGELAGEFESMSPEALLDLLSELESER